MQEVVPRIFIGDYGSSQSVELLEKYKIRHVIAAMRQGYDVLQGTTVYRVEVDDTDTTNIICHFDAVSDFIGQALKESDDGGVLVHCQAGISRSTTLVIAYLMKANKMDVDKALEIVKSVRKQAEPIDFFLHQLEMYERCNYEWNPVKYSEQRRFLMNFAQSQIMDGSSPSIVLAYYPSPAPSPKERTLEFGMTPINGDNERPQQRARRKSNSSADLSRLHEEASARLAQHQQQQATTAFGTPTRKRLTQKSSAQRSPAVPTYASSPSKTSVERIGSKSSVAVTGRRIRCKICRRELAAREHVLDHEPGKGQQAFAPHRRDMAAYRQEIEQRKREGAPPSFKRTISERNYGSSAPQPPNLSALRISQPPNLRISRPPPGSNISSNTASGPSSRPLNAQTPLSASDAIQEGVVHDFGSESVPSVPTDAPDESTSQDDEQAIVDEDDNDDDQDGLVEEYDPPLLHSERCSSYFTEPLSWMSPTLEKGELAGRIVCPNAKCGSKLGSFDWAGLQCSCGAWVCPGFALNVSKVDEVIGAPILPAGQVNA